MLAWVMMQQKLLITVEQREVVTNGQVPGTKDSGEVAQQRYHLRLLWPGGSGIRKVFMEEVAFERSLDSWLIGRPMFVLRGL